MSSEITRLEPTLRTTPSRLAKRAGYEVDHIYDILDEGLFCTIAYVQDGRPFSLPTGYCRIGDKLYIHGSVGSHMLRAIEQGIDLCISVTLVDGLVLARSAFHHSINYRSVVLFAKASVIEDETEKWAALEAFTNHYAPGRWDELRPMTASELRRTMVLSIPISEASFKQRNGPVNDEEEDAAWPCWAGVLPLGLLAGTPSPDAGILPDIPVPDYLKNYDRKARE